MKTSIPKKYRNYTNEEAILAVKQSKSIAQVCRLLGLVPIGGNYKTIGRLINSLSLDVKHFTGQGWNVKNYKPLSAQKSRQSLKLALIRERGHKCEGCDRKTWLRKPIPLELDHIDGAHHNDSKDNLRLLCPNCHALTPTYRGRNNKMVSQEGLEPTLISS